MTQISRHTEQSSESLSSASRKSYNELVEFLDSHWIREADRTKESLDKIKKIDQALGSPSKAFTSIIFGGSNGKSLTIHFAERLLITEHVAVGSYYNPHVLTYNERFAINGETIGNKQFTEIGNEVLTAAATVGVSVDSLELLSLMALLHFKKNNVAVGLFEINEVHANHPLSICPARIFAITRVTDEDMVPKEAATEEAIRKMLEFVQPKMQVISADQSKINLQLMARIVEEHGATWGMPIRKLAALPYPYEQIHGRCAALAERVCQMYANECAPEGMFGTESILAKQKVQRGRPTIKAKRDLELNPRRTLEQYRKDVIAKLPARFQLLEKEKPSVLLDAARNIDALKNVLLGIRLLHYQKTLKGIAFVIACDKNQMFIEELLSQLRYFAKKNSAHFFFCPIEEPAPGTHEESWDVTQVTNDVKSMKLKVRATNTFVEAFELAQKAVDERNGLVVVTGSQSIVATYWHHRGIKKV